MFFRLTVCFQLSFFSFFLVCVCVNFLIEYILYIQCFDSNGDYFVSKSRQYLYGQYTQNEMQTCTIVTAVTVIKFLILRYTKSEIVVSDSKYNKVDAFPFRNVRCSRRNEDFYLIKIDRRYYIYRSTFGCQFVRKTIRFQ